MTTSDKAIPFSSNKDYSDVSECDPCVRRNDHSESTPIPEIKETIADDERALCSALACEMNIDSNPERDTNEKDSRQCCSNVYQFQSCNSSENRDNSTDCRCNNSASCNTHSKQNTDLSLASQQESSITEKPSDSSLNIPSLRDGSLSQGLHNRLAEAKNIKLDKDGNLILRPKSPSMGKPNRVGKVLTRKCTPAQLPKVERINVKAATPSEELLEESPDDE